MNFSSTDAMMLYTDLPQEKKTYDKQDSTVEQSLYVLFLPEGNNC